MKVAGYGLAQIGTFPFMLMQSDINVRCEPGPPVEFIPQY